MLLAVGLAYPFLVYFGLQILPAGFIAIGLFVLLAPRLAFSRKPNGRNSLPYLIAALVLLILAARSPMVGLKAYPVILSLALFAAFGYSLIWPPTIIEQIARIRHPDLPLVCQFLPAQGHDCMADVLPYQRRTVGGDRDERQPEAVDALQRIHLLHCDGSDIRG